ncbi:hypothetical protein A3F07_00900 [candidate division WWE3 bacterium RIFCSPHIGHO2_12_FULL_38_15]|uniref:Uncharacterized protein n=1 Tax=candidate division WWE3 bacterium RIFCSPHIGHO2_02_FULL_38_14 TaxID=1802620 RepID=A0A1F4VB81_UNCKA|nr:MAG: hypothetical protein A2793_00985 [candidate division WWE3 bacterium RIFCSPHIGHO2_01_FULL_38_45]OGC49132.1 MAG: hypothetical protein A3F07_00900 [candidate division WWE3 bacterium RIFCSPHIGHO2_12_FULL_38_15]OGC53588.1 MAG: hypothetical protein A3B64_04535 [candidate division WWE3 bacterium RIFCSPLOWO2_01_FULL_37_24]OGC54491.1 MAG: hypothetical protein A3D91_01165 [candidate division WWE3 bacterium RIFCSPHIGHO2_02_FULL_38_14]HLB51735.1 hypothetical protein [Patescibacteria group bacterium
MDNSNNKNLAFLILAFLLGMALTLPVFTKVPPHADEHQFYFNAFSIMGGEALHNYVHVAFTEYLLAAFFTVVNMFTVSGVNFPQAGPTMVTVYFARYFGLMLYILAFIFCVIVLQKGERKIKLRSVIFTFLYFGSIGVFERFFRVNSDSMLVLIFLNYLILSFWFHKKKASVFKFFILNLVFLFIATFTNLKSLYLIFPMFILNVVCPFFFYNRTEKPVENGINLGRNLPKIYLLIFYFVGLILGVIVLWTVFIPQPHNTRNFWYSVKKTIVHGTQFDFDFPGQSYGSWKVYIYDLFSEYTGFGVLLALILLFFVYRRIGKLRIQQIFDAIKEQVGFHILSSGELIKSTELILLLSLFAYYIGVSMAVVHWSRWGIPLGIITLMLFSVWGEYFLERIFVNYKSANLPLARIIVVLLFLTLVLRVAMTIDIYKTNYPELDGWKQTYKDVEKYLEQENIPPADWMKYATWFTGYTQNIKTMSLEQIANVENSDIKYVFVPYWNIGFLHTNKNIDLGTHNQRAIIDKYAESIIYRTPSLTSSYSHISKFIAWRVFGLSYTPEFEGMTEPQYAIVKLKENPGEINLNYEVGFNDMSHYDSPYSLIFNMKNLTDSYMFAPCYSFPDTVDEKEGKSVLPPKEFGIGGRTSGLYCHSIRFRLLFKGSYRIRVENLPDDSDGLQRVYSNMAGYKWDSETDTLSFENPTTMIPGEFGVATKEKYLPDLKFRVFYKHD